MLRQPSDQARRLLTRSWGPVEETLEGKDYLIGDFSGADIMLGHALFMSNRLGQVGDDMANIKGYIGRIEARPAFQKADSFGEPLKLPGMD